MSMSTAHRPYITTRKATTHTTAMVMTLKTRCSMAGIIGPSALPFGVMSEKRLATFAVLALGFVAVVLVGFWLVLRLAD
jgi:hypothetical protein